VCTVICRWAPAARRPVQLLALRDELAGRAFDLPGSWWQPQPLLVGGRDRQAGGTWCASDVASGVTAVVLNRPERRRSEPGAPSRGVLPLLAIREGANWPERVTVASMAGFNLVLARPDGLQWWSWDGQVLQENVLAPGIHWFTPRGQAHPLPDERFAEPAREPDDDQSWSDWLSVLADSEPSTDPLALLVRIPVGEDTFETVFGQFISARPGALSLQYAVAPDRRPTWTRAHWTAQDGRAVPAAG
jgi:hypothetical protein